MILKGDEARDYIKATMKHFSPEEFQCRCGCGALVVDLILLKRLDLLRARVGEPLQITSGYRCPAHNKAVGGKSTSEHVDGQGVDIAAPSSWLKMKIVREALPLGFNRVGIGQDFVHLGVSDTLPKHVLWTY